MGELDPSKYQSNSIKSKQTNAADNQRKEKVIKGKASKKKKSEISKFANDVIAEDAHNVFDYVRNDVLIPAFKNIISDVVTNSIEMILYGEVTGRSGGRKRRGDRVSYDNYGRRDRGRGDDYVRRRSSYDYDDVLLDSRSEAESILTKMDELIDTYGSVSVADMYDLAGVDCNYTDNKYGWTNLRSASTKRDRSGKYVLDLPKAVPLD